MSDKIDVYKVVKKLIGPINAVGETHEDGRRLENAEAMTELVDKLLFDIGRASQDAGRVEYSMKKIGMHCKGFLDAVAQSDLGG